MAWSLSDHPGFIWLDSAGHLGPDDHNPISIIAVAPERIVKCHTASLDRELAGQPLPALGYIDYDGQAVMGLFEHMLLYDHSDETWWARGRIREMDRNYDDSDPPKIEAFEADSSEADFVAAVERALAYISAGDIYQVNLAQRFKARCTGGSLFELYRTLRQSSPAPMSAYIRLDGCEVLSSSPETFLDLQGQAISTRPIKGTRPRSPLPVADDLAVVELLASEKERAELVMITDLLRNDIGEVCEYGSVRVDSMLRLETYEHVHHLISTVSGTLREGISHADALHACYPGGSITGAPKKRAMEIIEELEPVPRGPYTGVVGFFGIGGRSKFNIAIRSLVRRGDELSYHVGAGIVADSDPVAEYQETLQKARGIQLAIERFGTG